MNQAHHNHHQMQQQQQQNLNQLTYLRFDRSRKTSSTEVQSVTKASMQLVDNEQQSDSNKLGWRLHQSNNELKKTPTHSKQMHNPHHHLSHQSHHHHHHQLQTQQAQYDANYANNSHHYSPMTCGLNSNNAAMMTTSNHLNANYIEPSKRLTSTFNERASNMM
jgi:hypothetical protein